VGFGPFDKLRDRKLSPPVAWIVVSYNAQLNIEPGMSNVEA
jgi:hypothetical protein